MDLFEKAAEQNAAAHAPLADRMRPRNLAEVVGQEHLLGEGKVLRLAIERDQVPSLILWGPPGTGKTTLARVIAQHTRSEFVAFSAVLGGVKEIREIVAEAQRRLGEQGRRTLLFVDEIHRFNRGQQDALLPHVERGLLTLVGATTENPSFEINAALLSRTRVLTLRPLTDSHVEGLLARALQGDAALQGLNLAADSEALPALARGAFGDARRALGALELAAAAAGPGGRLTVALVEEALAQPALRHDKSGDAHYDLVSAFIKSMRGSDPDAALYYAARLLEAGEDPRFLLRRMVIFASEDIGNADPGALQVAVNALQSVELIGMPEGVLPISQAVSYLACAEKSNAALSAFQAARADVLAHGPLEVPNHLRNAPTPLLRSLGHGAAYQYPHDFEGGYVAERYLPPELGERSYYHPSDRGPEQAFAARLERQRRARADSAAPPSPPKRRS
jgi:putative ATPase